VTIHISARLAWHMDGWNGKICSNPASNTFCVGNHSYPGDQIRVSRNLGWESEVAGKHCSELEGIPPCVYSINAFGNKPITGFSDPPSWYPANDRRTWELPPSTICIWPFEEMYRDEVKRSGRGQVYDYDKRLAFAKDYFAEVEENRSLVFYYANYSNPFSEEDARRYVVTGVSRVKKLGDVRNYENMKTEDRQRYGGGFVWALDLTSNYPDEGFRLPYHLYLDRPEDVERFVVVPSNPRKFKYATRQLSDDDALDLVEKLIESVGALQELGDKTEDWATRLAWLHTVGAELWTDRGLFPGMPAILGHLGMPKAISFFRSEVEGGREHEAVSRIFGFLDGSAALPTDVVGDSEVKDIRRRWALLEDDERRLISEALLRFELTPEQVARVLAPDRQEYGIRSSAIEIAANPYTLAEQYVGNDPDDTIAFTKVDHGMIPSPELGGDRLADTDDWRRLRALCVETLRGQQSDVFVAAKQLIHDINHRLSFYPEWKRHQFTERYLDVDKESLAGALTLRQEAGSLWVYLRQAYEDERLIEDVLRNLAKRSAVTFRTPMTEEHWVQYLRDPNSPLASLVGDEYSEAISGQAAVCADIFARPLCVLAGEAGTGKTTVVGAVLQAIERTEGAGASFQLLAPTGKAAERLREKTGRRGETATIHSFLARRGWLNDNLTFKRDGGQQEDSITTYVIDESSMLSLELTAALFRSINWNSVQRLVLVGDPSQLPPIGRGRLFADIIDWLRTLGGVGELQINVRQMENRALDRGTGILELAEAYARQLPSPDNNDLETANAENILRRVQNGGDVDKDLRVQFWRGGEDLKQQLIDLLMADVLEDTGASLNIERPWEFWSAGFDGNTRPERFQVLTPYRGEEFGTESVNQSIQEAVHQRSAGELRAVDGIALGDKVIQVLNRPRSNPIWAYCWSASRPEQVEVYNGELGFTRPHAFDAKKTRWAGFRPERLQVRFSTKPDHAVGYGRDLGKTPKGRRMRHESVAENLELAYAVSIHKAQGSEFDRVYFIVPKHKRALLSRELFYTGLTRATRHCTLLIEEDISPLLSMRRLEQSKLLRINASLFGFQPVPDELRSLGDWYEEGKVHATLSEYMVRSKSEVIITNMLAEREIPFRYEIPLYAPDGTFYLPDFTVTWQGKDWYWEHVGRLDLEDYRNHWETKTAWYEKHFPGQLVTTLESNNLSKDAAAIIADHFS
jgi:exodeoxyribonuclease V alpha subunit